jgi:hypothetical protein
MDSDFLLFFATLNHYSGYTVEWFSSEPAVKSQTKQRPAMCQRLPSGRITAHIGNGTDHLEEYASGDIRPASERR